MKNSIATIVLLFFCLLSLNGLAQCGNIPLADSSFEVGTLVNGGTFVPGTWYTDDGCFTTAWDPFAGDSCACSNGGGAFQVIPVDSNTTYHLSLYVRNALNDPLLHLQINWFPYHFSTSTNNWSFVSQVFNSGSDTTAIVGFYSSGGCFDQVRVTCSPLTSSPEITEGQEAFSIYPTISSNDFTLKSDRSLKVSIMDVSGKVVAQFEHTNSTKTFGHALPAATYLMEIRSKATVSYKKIIKL